MRISTRYICMLLPLALIVIVPTRAETQQACTFKCNCTSGGCGCRISGGDGANCHASGDGCYVDACQETLARSIFTPVGLNVVARQGMEGSATAGLVDHGVSSAMPIVRGLDEEMLLTWTWISGSYRQARSCAGVVQARHAGMAMDREQDGYRRAVLVL